MRRLLTLLLAGICAIAFTGCSKPADDVQATLRSFAKDVSPSVRFIDLTEKGDVTIQTSFSTFRRDGGTWVAAPDIAIWDGHAFDVSEVTIKSFRQVADAFKAQEGFTPSRIQIERRDENSKIGIWTPHYDRPNGRAGMSMDLKLIRWEPFAAEGLKAQIKELATICDPLVTEVRHDGYGTLTCIGTAHTAGLEDYSYPYLDSVHTPVPGIGFAMTAVDWTRVAQAARRAGEGLQSSDRLAWSVSIRGTDDYLVLFKVWRSSGGGFRPAGTCLVSQACADA